MTSTSQQPAPQEIPPGAQMLQLVGGAFVAQAVYVAAKLGIADLLKDGPKSAEYLAVATASEERSLFRLMRALASVGAFAEVEPKTFANTAMTDTLREDHPNSTRELTIYIIEPENWKVYVELRHSVKTNKPSWNLVHGEPVFP